MGEIPVCNICKNPMVLGNCYKCGGSGKVSFFGILPRTCPVCKGTKQAYHCTRYGEHEKLRQRQ